LAIEDRNPLQERYREIAAVTFRIGSLLEEGMAKAQPIVDKLLDSVKKRIRLG
jgi:hypothetical protein